MCSRPHHPTTRHTSLSLKNLKPVPRAPLEVRAVAISAFYALGTLVGGVAGPAVFGALIDTGSRDEVFWGYLLGGGLMLAGAAFAAALVVPAERRSLEEVAPPLSAA